MNLPLSMSRPCPVNMLWIGSELGLIERISMVSFLRAGHQVLLHAYSEIENVPDGVQVLDARRIASPDAVMALRHAKTGSYALASDYFRICLQEQNAGMWVDSDVVCIRPIEIETDYIFGLEEEGRINGAILRLPPDSPMVADILSGFRPGAIPRWLGLNRRRQLWMKRLFGIKYGPMDHPWGVFGPIALTVLADRHGVADQAQAIPVFYPYGWQRAAEIVAPGRAVEEFIGDETLTIHLWNEALGEHRRQVPPSTSALGRLMKSFGL